MARTKFDTDSQQLRKTYVRQFVKAIGTTESAIGALLPIIK